MTDKFYARFHVKHDDASDSYLRKAYISMDLHTDGTYVKEKTDWILMTKIEEKMYREAKLHSCISMIGNIVMNYRKILLEDKILFGDLLRAKILIIKLNIQFFFNDEEGRPQISYIDQFPEPKNMEQGNFLQKLSDSLEESKNKIITNLPPGSAVLSNNYFWLHGRKPFKEK